MTLHVAFKLGNANYAVPANEVLHLESYVGATHVPGAPPYVAGLMQIRSRLVPVVDLRARFGLPPIEHEPASERTLDRRVIVIQHGTRVAGLLVDASREVLQLDEATFAKPPEVLEAQVDGYVRAVATQKGRMFLLVDLGRVIGEEIQHG